MADHDDFDENAAQRTNNAPYTPRHPIPTIQRYEGSREERRQLADSQAPATETSDSHDTKDAGGFLESAKRHLHLGKPSTDESIDEDKPYQSSNRNVEFPDSQDGKESSSDHHKEHDQGSQSKGGSMLKDTSEAIGNTLDPKEKRKQMKHMQRDHATREVTDPVTHLKVAIHDSTSKELKTVPENEPAPGIKPRNSAMSSKDQDQLAQETQEQQAQHRGMEKVFPPPNFDDTREEVTNVYVLALSVGLGSMLLVMLLVIAVIQSMGHSTERSRSWFSTIGISLVTLFLGLTTGSFVILGLRNWLSNRIHTIWDDEIVRHPSRVTCYN